MVLQVLVEERDGEKKNRPCLHSVEEGHVLTFHITSVMLVVPAL